MIFRKKVEELSRTSTLALHQKLGLLVESVENAENVKASGAGWKLLSRWNALSEDAIHDDSVSRMQAFIMHPQLQNALHAGMPMLGNAFDKVVKNNAWAKSYDVENRKRKEEIRKQFSEEERKNSTTTEGEA